MKRSLYLIAGVLFLFGNVACANSLDKLLSENENFIKQTSGKTFYLYDTDQTDPANPIELSEKYFRTVLNGGIGNKNWEQFDMSKKGEAEIDVDSIENIDLPRAQARVQEYVYARKALIRSFRYDLLDLNDRISKYVAKFYK